MSAIDERLRNRKDLEAYAVRCHELDEKIDALRLEMLPLSEELSKLETENWYKQEQERLTWQLREAKRLNSGSPELARVLEPIEKEIQRRKAEAARRKELLNALRILSAKTAPLYKEQKALHAEIQKARIKFETDYLQPELRLTALKTLESMASMESQISTLDCYK